MSGRSLSDLAARAFAERAAADELHRLQAEEADGLATAKAFQAKFGLVPGKVVGREVDHDGLHFLYRDRMFHLRIDCDVCGKPAWSTDIWDLASLGEVLSNPVVAYHLHSCDGSPLPAQRSKAEVREPNMASEMMADALEEWDAGDHDLAQFLILGSIAHSLAVMSFDWLPSLDASLEVITDSLNHPAMGY